MGREGFLRQRIELASTRISLDSCVELFSVKYFEPCAETCQLLGRQLLDGSFDVFGGCHFDSITPEKHSGKARRL
jgi:hypothetical protein